MESTPSKNRSSLYSTRSATFPATVVSQGVSLANGDHYQGEAPPADATIVGGLTSSFRPGSSTTGETKHGLKHGKGIYKYQNGDR